MNKEFYIKWAENSARGVMYIGFKGTTVSLKILKGSCMRVATLWNILLSWKAIRDCIEGALKEAPSRISKFQFYTRTGMSKCEDVYILTPVKNTKFHATKKIWHESMLDKFNEDLDIYVRDLVDFVELQGNGGKFSTIDPVDDLRDASCNLDEASLIEISPETEADRWFEPKDEVNSLVKKVELDENLIYEYN